MVLKSQRPLVIFPSRMSSKNGFDASSTATTPCVVFMTAVFAVPRMHRGEAKKFRSEGKVVNFASYNVLKLTRTRGRDVQFGNLSGCQMYGSNMSLTIQNTGVFGQRIGTILKEIQRLWNPHFATKQRAGADRARPRDGAVRRSSREHVRERGREQQQGQHFFFRLPANFFLELFFCR